MRLKKYNANRARFKINLVMFLCLMGLGFLAVPVLNIQNSWAAEQASTMSDEAFNRRVRDYILKHPEIIPEAIRLLRVRERTARQRAVKSVLKNRSDELLRDPESPVRGNATGDVTLVEFFDYNCPYCRRVIPTLTKLLADDPKLRVVYKEFPILGANSRLAAKAALAARGQDKYIAFHEALMTRKGPITKNSIFQVAEKTGLDVNRLKKDMEAPKIAVVLQQNIKLGRALGINGTPGFIIGEQIFPGAVDLETLQSAIQHARKTQKSSN